MDTMLIYPGTFNPFHQGHAAVVKAVSMIYPAIPIVVIPTGVPPHRQDPLAGIDHRIAMAKLALAHYPNVTVSPLEADLNGPHYTAETLQKLCLTTPNLTLVLGRDALLSLPTWHQANWIINHVNLLAINRDTDTLPGLPPFFDPCPSINWVTSPVHPASASVIRTQLAQNKPLPADWLAPAVAHYIDQWRLYKTAN